MYQMYDWIGISWWMSEEILILTNLLCFPVVLQCWIGVLKGKVLQRGVNTSSSSHLAAGLNALVAASRSIRTVFSRLPLRPEGVRDRHIHLFNPIGHLTGAIMTFLVRQSLAVGIYLPCKHSSFFGASFGIADLQIIYSMFDRIW